MSERTRAEATGTSYNWRLLAILVGAILASVILVTPYSLSLQKDVLEAANLPVPLRVLLPVQWLQTTILYGGLAAIGLWIAGRMGLGLPFLESWLVGRPDWGRVRRFAGWAILAGILSATAIIALDALLFAPSLTVQFERSGVTMPEASALTPPAWQGFLASFYGGITEEILLRLFVLSLLAWVGRALTGATDKRPGPGVLWTASVLAAILFGLGHLPATAAAGLPLTGLVVTRAIVLNGLAGVVFGWFYWTFGLEAAMVSHFAADIILHVVAPLVMGG